MANDTNTHKNIPFLSRVRESEQKMKDTEKERWLKKWREMKK